MTTKDTFRIPPEVRDKGLEILYSDLPDMEKCGLLEELLRPADWNPSSGYSWTSMASNLGIPFRKFHYQLLKSYFRDGDRRRRHSVRQTKALVGEEITSQKLGFGLWLPKDWKVGDGTDEYGDEPHLNERSETVPAVSGFWNVIGETTTVGAPSDLRVEVCKYQLDEPLTSLDLYQRCAPRWPEVATSRGPSSPLKVSGMEAIRYTAHHWPMSNEPTPAVCAIYMSDGITGWEVSLWGGHEDAPEAFVISYEYQKALFFSRIAPSFRTLI